MKKIPLPQEYKTAIETIFKGQGLIDYDEMALKKKEEVNKQEKKIERRKLVEEKFTMKKAPYENCEILAPDGALLSRTNKKKVKWYLEKGLGVLVKEDPPTVQLKFEPKSREAPYVATFEVDKDLYLKHHRLNRCVVCGQEESLSRYYIVPSLYRQHLPLKVKDHNAHDILITCFRCQEKAHAEADKRKVDIAKKFDVPLVQFDKSHDIKSAVASVQKHLATFHKHKEVITKDKKKKLKETIREDFSSIQQSDNLDPQTIEAFKTFNYKENGQVKINETIINYFANLKTFKELVASSTNKDFKNVHGKYVIEKLTTLEDVSNFIEEWRMFFLDTMDPQFLPHDWHVVLQKKANLQKL